MLDLSGISKTFNPGTINEKRALHQLSLHLDPGDFVTVIGGNGAGKSTMLNAIAGVWPVDEGRIVLDGHDVTALPEHKRAWLIGRVFQDPMMGTAPNMQLVENLALAKRRGQKRGLSWGVTKEETEEYRERTRYWQIRIRKWWWYRDRSPHKAIVEFRFAYGPNAPRMAFEVRSVGISSGFAKHPEWGEPTTTHYVIVLGERVALANGLEAAHA